MNELQARVDALDRVWQQWAALGARSTDEQWRAPTRCTGWDVAAVYAHVSVFPLVLDGPLPPVDALPEEARTAGVATAVEILRGFNEPSGVAHTMAGEVADTAVAQAAATDRAELVDRFIRHGAGAVAKARTRAPDTAVPWPASSRLTTVVEALRIVVVESTVHLLDVLRALDLPPDVDEGALRETALVLAEMAPPVAFVEAATGRAAESPLPVLR